MNSKITRRFEMFARVKDFGATHSAELPARAGVLLTQLGACVDAMVSFGNEQFSGQSNARAGTSTRQEIAMDIRERMQAIVRVARVLDPQQFPGASKLLRAPSRKSYQPLLSAARSFVEEATPIKQAFLDRGETPTFLDELTAKVAEFDVASSRKQTGMQEQVGGTAGLAGNARLGSALVNELDAIVRNHFRNNRAVLRSWRTASRAVADPDRNAEVTEPPAQTVSTRPMLASGSAPAHPPGSTLISDKAA